MSSPRGVLLDLSPSLYQQRRAAVTSLGWSSRGQQVPARGVMSSLVLACALIFLGIFMIKVAVFDELPRWLELCYV